MVNQPPINLGGQQGARSLYQFTLQDTDTAELYRWAPILEAKMRDLPGIEDVSSDLQIKNPQIQVDLDRDKISALGLNVNQVETALYNAYGTRQVSQIYAPEQPVPGDPAGGARVPAGSGGALEALRPLSRCSPDVAGTAGAARARSPRSRTDAGPLTVSHTGQLPSVTISFNLKPGYALGDAVTAIRTTAARDAAVDHRDHLPGHGAGVPGFAAGPRPDPADGDRRHLHRAGDPLRELHAPADDSLGAAVGRLRRAADAATSSRPS